MPGLPAAISRKALFIGGEWRAAAGGKTFDASDPSTGKLLAKVSRRRRRRYRRGGCGRRARRCRNGAQRPAIERAKVLYAIGRAMQRHQRLFAVLESIDNGKPIRESRDIDVPLAIRHFIHHAGWAQALDSEFPGSQAGRRRRPDHPVEFPAADARLEDRAGARRRLHGRAEAGRVHAADRDPVRRDLRAAPACRRASSTSCRAGRRRARRSSTMPASTRSPSPARRRSARSSARRPPAPARSCRWSSAASRPSSSSRTPISTAPSKGWSTASGSTRARSAAPARACWCRKASPRPSSPRSRRA